MSLADAEAGGERPQGQAERDERGQRERRPRLGAERLLAREQMPDREDHEGPEPVDVVQRRGGALAGDQQDHADQRLHDGDDLRRDEPSPEPVPRLTSGDPQDQAEQPPDREDPNDDEPYVAMDLGHGGRILRGREAPGIYASGSVERYRLAPARDSRSLLSRRDRCNPSSANSRAEAATPGDSSSTPRRCNSLDSPGSSPNCASSSLAGSRS